VAILGEIRRVAVALRLNLVATMIRRGQIIVIRHCAARKDNPMPLHYTPKDPNDIDFFSVDWSTYPLNPNETILSCVCAVEAGDVSVTGNVATISGQVTTAEIAGGTLGETARVRYRITTSQGRQLDQTIAFRLDER
jgi:hypothetical protein